MCTICKDVLRGFKKHTPFLCPLSQSSYCGICASYGHCTDNCTDTHVLQNRVPVYLEQLLSPSVLESYSIRSRTPLHEQGTEKQIHDSVLEVMDSDKHIRAILMNYSKQISGKAKENRIRIQKLGDEIGRKIVFVKVDEALKEVIKKETKTSKA